MASFVPTFAAQGVNCAVTEGALEEQDIAAELESKYLFIFVVDRSGSMGLSNRMQITIDALKLFIQSLPTGSRFGILSFGSDCSWSKGHIMEYNNGTKEASI